MAPPVFIVLALCVFTAGLATLLTLLAVSTERWERIVYDPGLLRQVNGLRIEESVFVEDQGLFQLVLVDQDADPEDTSLNATTYYVRNTYGGIWKLCDTVDGGFRSSVQFRDFQLEANYLGQSCFSYIPDYPVRKENQDTDQQAVALIRMQNSAASCVIVSVLCLVSAILTGVVGLWQKQVSACMVTGVMHIVAGVFLCFALIIETTKVGYMQTECYNVDPLDVEGRLCHCRTVTLEWSVYVAWLAFSIYLLAFAFWLYLSRCLRLESAKSII